MFPAVPKTGMSRLRIISTGKLQSLNIWFTYDDAEVTLHEIEAAS
jgi:hypothetical protein